MSNLMEFEEISAKMRLERNRSAGQSISSLVEGVPGFAVKQRSCRPRLVMRESRTQSAKNRAELPKI
jgi:hypothetical protein